MNLGKVIKGYKVKKGRVDAIHSLRVAGGVKTVHSTQFVQKVQGAPGNGGEALVCEP